MKRLLMVTIVFLAANAAQALPAGFSGKYNIHLYFGESHFLDTLTLENKDGVVTGVMHVPNDFDAPVENFTQKGGEFSFEFTVPATPTRPKPYRARYFGRFYDGRLVNLAGFGTVVDTMEFMASYIGNRVN